MQRLFFAGISGLILFEILNVYFIMPMPGSQQMTSIGIAWFLYSWRWVFRLVFAVMVLAGIRKTLQHKPWIAGISIVAAMAVIFMFNFKMSADKMFYQPRNLVLKDAAGNKIPEEKLVIGITVNGKSKAYPIQLIGYHHQVLDTVGGLPVMVTYCTVCRTGRVFEPKVKGKPEKFRLVGMDHFNAMFEDETTGSWWRQANGEAIAGKLSGEMLPEVFSQQMTLRQWLMLHPETLVMQPDSSFKEQYEHLKNYDKGKGKSSLTKTDSLSGKDKSWVVGVITSKGSKSFDWNLLKKDRVINDFAGSQPVVVVLAADTTSFFAFERPGKDLVFAFHKDSLCAGNQCYGINGLAPDKSLKPVRAYQEFRHSWQTFHPDK